MRTIKFRGKRLDGQGWVYGYPLEKFQAIDAQPRIVIDTCRTFTNDGYHSLEQYEVLPESVGQWTGLVDKNGKEIFEGDMVKAENTQNVGEIKYVHEHGSFLVYSHDENGAYYEYLDIGLCEKYFEVIGNVFDNGDLYDC